MIFLSKPVCASRLSQAGRRSASRSRCATLWRGAQLTQEINGVATQAMSALALEETWQKREKGPDALGRRGDGLSINRAALFLWDKMMEQPAVTSDPLVGTWKLVSFLKYGEDR